MRTFKKFTAFVAVLLVSCCAFTFLLAQPSVMKIMIKQTQRNQCDTVFVGQSHGESDVDPFLFDKETGSNSMNCSRRLTPNKNLYYVVKDCNSKGNLKRVFCEIDPTYWTGFGGGRGEDVNGLFYLSPVMKAEYFFKEMLDNNFTTALFDYGVNQLSLSRIPSNIRIRTNIDYIKKNDDAVAFINDSIGVSDKYEYKGKGFRYGLESEFNPEDYESFTFNEEDVTDDCVSSFKKLAAYCRDNGIELVCINYAVSPYRLQHENLNDAYTYFSALCKEENVEYIDFNYAKQEYLPRTNSDFVDVDGHMMGEMAERQTKLLTQILKNPENKDKYFYSDYSEVINSLK